MGDDQSLLALDNLRDVYALAIHNTKLSRERWTDLFMTYPILEFNVAEKL